MDQPLIDPLSGASIDPDNPAELLAAARRADREIGRRYSIFITPLREIRDELHRRLAETAPAMLPEPRYRTRTQEKVALCPRCRSPIADEPSAESDRVTSP